MSEYEKLSERSRFARLKTDVVAGEEIACFFVYLLLDQDDQLSADEAEDLRMRIAELVKAEVS